MAGIMAVYNGDSNSPGYTISLSGLLAFDTYTVVRQDYSFLAGTYPETPVRGADDIPVLTDTTTVTDYETPIGSTVNYQLRGYVGGVLTTSVDAGSDSITQGDVSSPPVGPFYWIKNISDPTLSRSVLIAKFDENDYEPAILGEYKVLGRRKPVVFTDVGDARSGNFECLAITIDGTYTTEVNALKALLLSGDVLLFQTIFNNHQIRDMYFIVTSLSRQQYDAPGADRTNDFTYTIGFQEVDQPLTSGLATSYGTWQDLKDDLVYTTWADVIADNATWDDVLIRYTV